VKTKINEIIRVIEILAPLELAEDWDNVGLLSGDPENATDKVLLTLDITETAYKIALDAKAGLIVSHHPLIYDPIRRFDSDDPQIRLVTETIRSDIAIYAAHTNLDSCKGGVSDSLAEILELDVIDGGSNELTSHGFLSLRKCITRSKETLFSMYSGICEKLKIPGCFTNFDTNREVRIVSVSGGSFSSDWIDEVVGRNTDCVITGEMKHHDMLRLAGYGIGVIAAGHAASERVVLDSLADHITQYLPDLTIAVYDGLDYNKVIS